MLQNNCWRSLDEWREIEPDDEIYHNLASALAAISMLPEIIKYDGGEYRIKSNTGIVLIGDSDRGFPILRAHRTEACHVFSVAEVQQAIRVGDDAVGNMLGVDHNGHVVLTPREKFDKQRLAVCMESFDPGNDYVGEAAANDEEHVNDCARMLMQGFATHLISGKMGVYIDWCPSESLSDLRSSVDEAFGNLR